MQEKKYTNVNFSMRFCELLEKCGLTQKELAAKLGMSEGAIVNYKKDRVPKAEELRALAAYFEVSMEWLLTGFDPAPSGKGGPGNAPMYNPGLGAKARIEKSLELTDTARKYREMAEKMETDRKELLETAKFFDDWAQSLLEEDEDYD